MIDNLFVIDSHCHVYPDKIALKAVEGTGNFYKLGNEFDGKVSTLICEGGKAGVDHFVVQSVATSPKQVQSINKFISETVLESNGKMTGLGTLHPDSSDILEDIQHIRELGLKGVKLHPDIQQFKIDDFRCLKIYELCEKFSLPILMHTGDHRFDYSNPNRMLPIMKIYENLTVVGAHLGGWSVWDDAVENLSQLKNFYVDTSSSFKFMPRERARKIIDSYGVSKVLFATDYPMWNINDEISYFLSLGFTNEECEKIFSKNAQNVFNITLESNE